LAIRFSSKECASGIDPSMTAGFISLAGAISLLAGNAWGGIIVSNGGGCCLVIDYEISGAANPFFNGIVEQAFAFTPANSFNFTELDIELGYQSGTNSVTVDLMNDSGGIPGAVLDSWSVNNLADSGTLKTLFGDGTISLASGTQYWVAALPGGADTWASWYSNSTGVTGPAAQNLGAGWALVGACCSSGAFDVQGTESAAPEPGTAVLTFAACVLAALGKLRSRMAAI
jgi:hypothetical protein